MQGVFETTGCMGAPAYGSAPHFLQADPDLADAVEGLSPDPALHTTFLK